MRMVSARREKGEVMGMGKPRMIGIQKPYTPNSKAKNPQQKYCEYACRERGYAEKESEIQRRYREKRKAERLKTSKVG